MSIKIIGRASLALVVGAAALGLTGCELGGDRTRDDDGYGRYVPPPHWPKHDRDGGRDRDRDHGRDRDRDRDRGRDRDWDRGGRERDHDRRASLTPLPDGRAVTVLASLDGDAAGRLFDGRQ